MMQETIRRTKLLYRSLAVAFGCGLSLVAVFGLQPTLAAQSKAQPSAAAPRVWPGFVVDVTLSPKAKARLTSVHESLRVFGSYSGVPKKGALKKYISEEGAVSLGDLDLTFPLDASAHIDKVTVNQIAFAQTDGKTPMVLINVVSARKSSPDNLLSCDIFEDSLDKIQGGHIPIACKLIGE